MKIYKKISGKKRKKYLVGWLVGWLVRSYINVLWHINPSELFKTKCPPKHQIVRFQF